MLNNEEEEHALERLAEVEDEIRQVEKELQDLRSQWELEKSGLGDVQKMRELRITNGTSGATYSPDAILTRQEIAVFAVRAFLL